MSGGELSVRLGRLGSLERACAKQRTRLCSPGNRAVAPIGGGTPSLPAKTPADASCPCATCLRVRLVYERHRRRALVSSFGLARMHQSAGLIDRDAVAIEQPQGAHRSKV